jgi:ATP-dependent 26S proteasome regulatory subunit
MNLTRGINLRKIAELMPGASGAEVKVTNRTVNISRLPFLSGIIQFN